MFGGGGGGLDPRKMQKMMEQMGIDIDEIDAHLLHHLLHFAWVESAAASSEHTFRFSPRHQKGYALDQVPEPLSAPAGPFGANGVSF